MEPTKPRDHTNQNAVKLVGEAFVPGASLLLDGKIAEGGAHLLLGWAARALLGPVGLALVVANSYSKSTTGKSLLKQFTPETHTTTRTETRLEPVRTETKIEHTKTPVS